jgi:hypothetical protein
VVTRLATYAVKLPLVARRYADAVLALSSVQEWSSSARAEPEFYAPDEPYAAAR